MGEEEGETEEEDEGKEEEKVEEEAQMAEDEEGEEEAEEEGGIAPLVYFCGSLVTDDFYVVTRVYVRARGTGGRGSGRGLDEGAGGSGGGRDEYEGEPAGVTSVKNMKEAAGVTKMRGNRRE